MGGLQHHLRAVAKAGAGRRRCVSASIDASDSQRPLRPSGQGQMLVGVAHRLRSVVRGELLARLGGDGSRSSIWPQPSHAGLLGERIGGARRAVRDRQTVQISGSVSIPCSPPMRPIDRSHQECRRWRYRARMKAAASPFYEAAMDLRQRASSRSLGRDRERGHPLSTMATSRQLISFGALLRWTHRNWVIGPVTYIRLAEESGLILAGGVAARSARKRRTGTRR